MRKFKRILPVFVFILCINLFCGCSKFTVEKLRLSGFGVALPNGTEIIYSYDATDGGGGGEGNVYYVNKIPKAERFVADIESSVQSKEEFISEFKNFLRYFKDGIEREYLPDFDGEIIWAVKVKDYDERDKTLLFFSYATGLVYVGIVER